MESEVEQHRLPPPGGVLSVGDATTIAEMCTAAGTTTTAAQVQTAWTNANNGDTAGMLGILKLLAIYGRAQGLT